jgi:nitrite reductase/ring-hydroxylating ferredoxin subunit
MTSFVKVAAVAEIAPGRGKCVEARGRRIALFNIRGSYYAIDDACPHTGAPLCEGDLEDAEVTCPWHGAVFDVTTGACREGPSSEDVASYRVRVIDGNVEVEV